MLARLRLLTMVIVTFGLVGSLAVAIPAAAEDAENPPPAAGPVDSDDDGTLDAPDTAAATAGAAAKNKPVESLDKRTETVTVLANPDGSFTSKEYATPVRVKQGGEWVDVDYTLAKKADGSWEPKASPVDVSIAGGSAKEAARVTFNDGESLAVTWPENLPTPTVNGGVATYKLSEATDLVVSTTSTGVNTRIRLNKKPASDDPIFSLGLRAEGVDVDQTAAGGLKIANEDGKTIAKTSTLVAWDATTDHAGDPANVVDLNADLDQTSTNGDVTQHTLDLATPDGFLSDPTTAYPVVVDPDISMNKVRDTWVRSGDNINHSAENRLIVGKIDPASSSNGNPARSFLKFYNGTIEQSGVDVVSAELGLYQYYGYSCTDKRMYVYPVNSVWDNGGEISWTSMPTVASTGATHVNTNRGATGCGADWTTVDVTNMAKAWAAKTLDMQGIRLHAHDESTSGYERRFCSMNPESGTGCNTATRTPYLSVTYNQPPTLGSSVPAVLQANGAATATASASDPDGGTVQIEFNVRRGTETVFDGLSAAAASGSHSVSLPSLPAGSYTVRARAYDGRVFSSWSPSGSFAITGDPGQSFLPDSTPNVLLDTATAGPLAPGEQRAFQVTLNEAPPTSEPQDDLTGDPASEPTAADAAVLTLSSSNWLAGSSLQLHSTDVGESDTGTVTMQSSVPGMRNVTTALVGVASGEIVVTNAGQNAVTFEITSQGWRFSPVDNDEGQGIQPLPEGVDTLGETDEMVALEPFNAALEDLYVLYQEYMEQVEGSGTGTASLSAESPSDDLQARIQAAQDRVAALAGQPIDEVAPLPEMAAPPTDPSSPTTLGVPESRLEAYKLPIRHSTQTKYYYCGPASTAMAIRSMRGPETSQANSSHTMGQTTLAGPSYLQTTKLGTNMSRIPITLKKWAGISTNLQPNSRLTTSSLKALVIVATGGYNKAPVYGTREYMYSGAPHYNFHYENLSKPLDHLISGWGYYDEANMLRYADPVAGRWPDPRPTRSMQASNMKKFMGPWGVVL